MLLSTTHVVRRLASPGLFTCQINETACGPWLLLRVYVTHGSPTARTVRRKSRLLEARSDLKLIPKERDCGFDLNQQGQSHASSRQSEGCFWARCLITTWLGGLSPFLDPCTRKHVACPGSSSRPVSKRPPIIHWTPRPSHTKPRQRGGCTLQRPVPSLGVRRCFSFFAALQPPHAVATTNGTQDTGIRLLNFTRSSKFVLASSFVQRTRLNDLNFTSQEPPIHDSSYLSERSCCSDQHDGYLAI